MTEPIFPITHCKRCGAIVRRIDNQLYRIDKIIPHTCDTLATRIPLTIEDEKQPA